MSLVIGLTGGIASGKSTAAEYLQSLGVASIDADAIALALTKIDAPLYKVYCEHFGESCLYPDGSLNRRRIGKIVFADESERQWLNETAQPLIRQAIMQRLAFWQAKNKDIIILDIPLLFETDWYKKTAGNVLIYVDEITQLKRLQARNGYSLDEAQNRIKAQMPLANKKALADWLIDNNGTVDKMQAQLYALWQIWKDRVDGRSR